MPITRLSLRDRMKIEKFIQNKIPTSKMAKLLRFRANTINVEIRRNGGKENYNAILAQKGAESRQAERLGKLKKVFTDEDKEKLKRMVDQRTPSHLIRREFKMNHINIMNLYRSCGIEPPSFLSIITSIEDRLLEIEQKIDK